MAYETWEPDGWYDARVGDDEPTPDALPRLDDHTTLDLLLDQVRERWGDSSAWVCPLGRAGFVVVGEVDGLRGRDRARAGSTEAEAIVIALEGARMLNPK